MIVPASIKPKDTKRAMAVSAKADSLEFHGAMMPVTTKE